jgi:hypothetical protein
MALTAAQPKAEQPNPPMVTQRKVSFGVSVIPSDLEAIDRRIAAIEQRFGVTLTRSNYFALVARYDRERHVIEQLFSAPNGSPNAA